MEHTGVSIGKSVLNGALRYATSAIADEVALQLGVHRDKVFVTDELEMMQSFLMAAGPQAEHNKVVRTWVKQVRDVAYDVEDGLQDFVVRLQKQKQSWWRIPRTLLDRRHVAKQMKDLRAKVEDVSQRNVRYRLIDDGAKLAKASDYSTTAAMFGVDEARHAANQHQSTSRLDLAQLIINNGGLGSNQIGVIGVWGTSGTVGHTSLIWEAYENPNVKLKFECRAWVRLTQVSHPKEFVQSIVKQFRAASVGVVDERYLIVITDLSTIEEWQQIKTCFPENKLGSRIVVSTEQVEVASLCPGQESIVSELKQLSAEQTIYAFYQQSSQEVPYSSKPLSNSTLPYTAMNEIHEDESNIGVHGMIMVQERLTRANTMAGLLEEFQLIGREKEKSDIIELIREQASTQQLEVIALWGMGGLGKTTLIKEVYHRQEVTEMFEKYAFVPVLRPFKLEEFLRSLASQLQKGSPDRATMGTKDNHRVKQGGKWAALELSNRAKDSACDTQKSIEELGRHSEGKSCLIILDDLSSTMEWDKIVASLRKMKSSSLVIVITTRREDIAKHCCRKPTCIRLLKGLEEKDACTLFTKKLTHSTFYSSKKCNGLPLAIVTIGGFLADQPKKTVIEWRKLNEHISIELEMNPKFEAMKTVLMKSYDGLPYYLKSCFLYFSIFPEDRNVSRRRLVYRWIAEGYAIDRSVADRYFMELVERSMILPTQQSFCSLQGIDSCYIAKSMEENLVFRLEEGCSSNTHGAVRHLSISSSWKGDECEFESTVELSRVRSLTVFGDWKPFYISGKMRFLRVLDLEGTKGLANHHLKHIGKHLHLKYLSLRGCENILSLPNSVAKLPKTIIKLSKLCYLHAGNGSTGAEETNWSAKCQFLGLIKGLCLICCLRENLLKDDFDRCDAAAVYCIMYLFISAVIDDCGVKVPRGIRKMKALRTLRYVHLDWGNAVIKEIRGLTSLRKLGVVGINKKNGTGFCSAISSLSRLESLSVLSGDGLIGCLDGMTTAPENLQSLKLSGKLEKLPEWIMGLQNLVKLKLQFTSLSCNREAMEALGKLPNLCILGLCESDSKIDVLQFKSGLFKKLTVLDLLYVKMEIRLVEFEEESVPNLEMLILRLQGTETAFSGVELLQSIKEVQLRVEFPWHSPKHPQGMEFKEWHEEEEKKMKLVKDKVSEELRIHLDRNTNRPVLKVE
ncbi:hypothetical protein VPH35_113951 [Triticum aestivum]